MRGAGDDQSRNVAQDTESVVVMEVATKSLLVGVASDTHHHRIAVRALREELQCRRFASQLVLGVVEVGQILDLCDGQHPQLAGADGDAHDGLFIEQRIEHAAALGTSAEIAGDAVDSTLVGNIFAEEPDFGDNGP